MYIDISKTQKIDIYFLFPPAVMNHLLSYQILEFPLQSISKYKINKKNVCLYKEKRQILTVVSFCLFGKLGFINVIFPFAHDFWFDSRSFE